MRILLLTHGLPPESVGGVEQHVAGLAEALVHAGHDVHVFARGSSATHRQGDCYLERAQNPRVTRAIYRWENVVDLDSIYHCAPMALTLRDFLLAERTAGRSFDVAHVHHLTGLSTDAIAVLREHGLPVVLTLHDYWLMCPRGQMWHKREEACAAVETHRCGDCLHATFGGWIPPSAGPGVASAVHERARDVLGRATCLVVPSAHAIPPYVALGIAQDRFTVVENGVDTAALERLPPPAAGPGPLRLGYLGTLLPSKGLHVLLAAIARLPQGQVELAIHGNAVSYHGDDTFLLRCLGGLQPGAGVRYHGPYRTGDLPQILAPLDVVCAPALWAEAFGLTIREALAAARPVLVSRVGGLQDAVVDGEQGLILPAGDVAAWASAIGRLAADRQLVRRMAQHARRRARGFLPMATDLLAIYAQAIATAFANPAPRSS